MERAVALFSAVDDQDLWRSFVAWCGGVLGPRLGGRLPILVDSKETTMLAETLREWDERNVDEGRRQGRREGQQKARQEGRREGQQEARQVLCSLAGRRFGADTGNELAALLAGVEDGAELERIGTLIIDCGNGPDFLARARTR